MKSIFLNEVQKITSNKKKLESELNVKIDVQEDEVLIDGKAVDEYIAEKVIEALDFGFSLSKSLSIKNNEFLFEIINIKDHTRRHDFAVIRGRIIGTRGKTLKTLSDLTECYLELKDNEIGIIGNGEHIKKAQDAIISIVKGSKQSNVYNFLEKRKIQPVEDLGLKEKAS